MSGPCPPPTRGARGLGPLSSCGPWALRPARHIVSLACLLSCLLGCLSLSLPREFETQTNGVEGWEDSDRGPFMSVRVCQPCREHVISMFLVRDACEIGSIVSVVQIRKQTPKQKQEKRVTPKSHSCARLGRGFELGLWWPSACCPPLPHFLPLSSLPPLLLYRLLKIK